MGLAMQHCTVDARACGIGHCGGVSAEGAVDSFVVLITAEGTVMCGHCRETAMHGVGILTHIEFRCADLIAVWTQTLPGCEPVVIHRCDLPEAEVTDEAILDLLLREPVTA